MKSLVVGGSSVGRNPNATFFVVTRYNVTRDIVTRNEIIKLSKKVSIYT